MNPIPAPSKFDYIFLSGYELKGFLAYFYVFYIACNLQDMGSTTSRLFTRCPKIWPHQMLANLINKLNIVRNLGRHF